MKRMILIGLALASFPVTAHAGVVGSGDGDPNVRPGGIVHRPPIVDGPTCTQAVSFENDIWSLVVDTDTYYGSTIPSDVTGALGRLGIHPRAEIDTEGHAWIESCDANGHASGFGFSAHAGALAQITPNKPASGTFDASAWYDHDTDQFCVDSSDQLFNGTTDTIVHQCSADPLAMSPAVWWYMTDSNGIDQLVDLGFGGNLHLTGSARYAGSALAMLRFGPNAGSSDPRLGLSAEMVGRATVNTSADVGGHVNLPDPIPGFDVPDYSATINLINNPPLQPLDLLDAHASTGFDFDADDNGNRVPFMYVSANSGYGYDENAQTYVQLPPLVNLNAVLPALPAISSAWDFIKLTPSSFRQTYAGSWVQLPVSSLWNGLAWRTGVPW